MSPQPPIDANFVAELEARQDALLEQLDELDRRVERTLAELIGGRTVGEASGTR